MPIIGRMRLGMAVRDLVDRTVWLSVCCTGVYGVHTDMHLRVDVEVDDGEFCYRFMPPDVELLLGEVGGVAVNICILRS